MKLKNKKIVVFGGTSGGRSGPAWGFAFSRCRMVRWLVWRLGGGIAGLGASTDCGPDFAVGG